MNCTMYCVLFDTRTELSFFFKCYQKFVYNLSNEETIIVIYFSRTVKRLLCSRKTVAPKIMFPNLYPAINGYFHSVVWKNFTFPNCCLVLVAWSWKVLRKLHVSICWRRPRLTLQIQFSIFSTSCPNYYFKKKNKEKNCLNFAKESLKFTLIYSWMRRLREH